MHTSAASPRLSGNWADALTAAGPPLLFALLMLAAWLVTIALRRIASRSGLLQYVWHPGAVRVCRVHHRSLDYDFDRRTLRCHERYSDAGEIC